MITIFNGRRRSLEDSKESVWMQVDVLMREHLYLFKNGKNGNPWFLFTAIALHANADGWSWPSTELLMTETGLSTEESITSALHHLRALNINGHPVLHHYRKRRLGQWGRSYYHIFPEAGGMEAMPDSDLFRWLPEPPPDKPGMVKPGMENRGDSSKDSHSEEEPESSNNPPAGAGLVPSGAKVMLVNGVRVPVPVAKNQLAADLQSSEGQPTKATPQPASPRSDLELYIAKLLGHAEVSEEGRRLLSEAVTIDGQEYPSPEEEYAARPDLFKEWVGQQVLAARERKVTKSAAIVKWLRNYDKGWWDMEPGESDVPSGPRDDDDRRGPY